MQKWILGLLIGLFAVGCSNVHPRVAVAAAAPVEVVIAEEPPEPGPLKKPDAMGAGFSVEALLTTRYESLQRRIRETLSREMNRIGLDVLSLEHDETYKVFAGDCPPSDSGLDALAGHDHIGFKAAARNLTPARRFCYHFTRLGR